MSHNPAIEAFGDRLLERRKAKMQAIVVIIRKLVHLAFGILKFQKPFDPNYSLTIP